MKRRQAQEFQSSASDSEASESEAEHEFDGRSKRARGAKKIVCPCTLPMCDKGRATSRSTRWRHAQEDAERISKMARERREAVNGYEVPAHFLAGAPPDGHIDGSCSESDVGSSGEDPEIHWDIEMEDEDRDIVTASELNGEEKEILDVEARRARCTRRCVLPIPTPTTPKPTSLMRLGLSCRTW